MWLIYSRSTLKLVNLDLEDFNTLPWRREKKIWGWENLEGFNTLLEIWPLSHSDEKPRFQWNNQKMMPACVHIISDYTTRVLRVFVF